MRVLAAALLPLACGHEVPADTGDTAPDVGGPATVAAVRDALDAGTLWEGSAVALSGVVATTGITGDGSAFFVQDVGGGERTGIRIHLGDVFDPVPASPGAVLDVAGTIAFYDEVPEIAVTAAGDVVGGGTADPVADPLACDTTDPAPWEGGLVSVADLVTTGPVDAYGEAPTACGLALDDLFTDFDLTEGTACVTASGVILLVRGEARLAPRDAGDLSSCGAALSPPPAGRPARRTPCAASSS